MRQQCFICPKCGEITTKYKYVCQNFDCDYTVPTWEALITNSLFTFIEGIILTVIVLGLFGVIK